LYAILIFIMEKYTHVKILVVDDEPDICEFVQSYFGRRGMQVTAAPSGEKALTVLKDLTPDIILLDVTLGNIDGIEVLKRLREFNQTSKVAIITGQTYSEEEVAEIKKIGATAFINKPLILEELAEVVYSILGNKPLPELKARFKRSDDAEDISARDIIHRLANILGIIRNKSENFILNIEDGVYNRTSSEDKEKLIDMSIEIMKENAKAIDRAMHIVEKIKEK